MLRAYPYIFIKSFGDKISGAAAADIHLANHRLRTRATSLRLILTVRRELNSAPFAFYNQIAIEQAIDRALQSLVIFIPFYLQNILQHLEWQLRIRVAL